MASGVLRRWPGGMYLPVAVRCAPAWLVAVHGPVDEVGSSALVVAGLHPSGTPPGLVGTSSGGIADVSACTVDEVVARSCSEVCDRPAREGLLAAVVPVLLKCGVVILDLGASVDVLSSSGPTEGCWRPSVPSNPGGGFKTLPPGVWM